MTFHVRLILITFVILIIASFTTTFIYYNLTGQLLLNTQSQNVINSTNSFVFALQNKLEKIDEDFNKISLKLGDFRDVNLESTNIDFIFSLEHDSLISISNFAVKKNSFLNFRSRSFRQLFKDNPNIVLRYSKYNNDIYYYGFLISPEFLDELSKKVGADIAFVLNDSPVELSNSNKNQSYLLTIVNAINNLKYKNNYDLYNEELQNSDFASSKITPHQILTPGGKVSFIIFNTFQEGVTFREVLRNVMIIIVLSGSALTFIVVLLVTTKFRKQVSLLSLAVETIKKGDLEHRVPIISSDELGKLAETFNSMLDEIRNKEQAEKDYTEFITLINQSPALKEISEAALIKIIKATGLTFGAIYIIQENNLRLVSSFGIGKNIFQPMQSSDFYCNVIEKKEVIEFNFSENFPEIKTGLTSIKIKYIIIFPIIYNKETIAILELASESKPIANVKDYINRIQEQLAIGLANARSLEQLENFVNELKRLNEEYQKQNKQIIQQNEELKELHKQINEKAIELEKQRLKAVELSKVKSQFLASMSHELRTPLISILGLTELLIKDEMTNNKAKERLGIVFRNGKKLLSMITNILEFSKLESGRIELKKDNFLLSDLLEEVKQNIEPIANEKKLKFTIQNPIGKNFLINTDKSKIEQILNNLLTNAVKFTEKGEVRLAVDLENDNGLKICVADTGIGISEENIQDIFSEFRQLDGSISRKYGGAGLGLTITKRYVEMLGGNLSVKSEINKGTEFTFSIKDIVLDVIETQGNQFLSLENDKNNLTNQSILIYCSNLDTKKFLTDYLHSYNYNIIPFVFDNEKYPIDNITNKSTVIFCYDENSPKMWQSVINFRSNLLTKDNRMIIVSILESEKVGWALPLQDVLIKPLSFNEIKRTIDNLEIYAETKVSKVLFCTPNNEEFEITCGNYEKIYHCSSIKDVINHLDRETLQLAIIDLDSLQSEALSFLFYISQNKFTKNVHTVFYCGKNTSNINFEKMNDELYQLTLKSKYHPLDVLKDLKDRLKIDDNLINKKQQLIEEIEYDKYVDEISKHSSDTKYKVLIVDDDPDTLFTIGEIIKEMNYDTVFAHNGLECLVMLNHIKPDIILLDIMMPQLDGFETIKRIRSDNRFSSIPVLALTAYAMLDNKNVITKNGFNDLVTKPVNTSLLQSKLNYYLTNKVS